MQLSEFSLDEKIKSICLLNEAIELAENDTKSIEALRMVKKLIQSEIDLTSLEANLIEENDNSDGYMKFNWNWNSESHSKEEEIRFQLFIADCAFQQRANMQRFANPYREPLLEEYSILCGNRNKKNSEDFTI